MCQKVYCDWHSELYIMSERGNSEQFNDEGQLEAYS